MQREVAPEPIRPSVPPMLLNVWTDEQITALREAIVESVAEALAANWLPRQPMTSDELAEYLHVSRETIRRWTVAGDIEAWQHGHTILYLPDAIAVFLGRGVR